jgi:hypothetical protein
MIETQSVYDAKYGTVSEVQAVAIMVEVPAIPPPPIVKNVVLTLTPRAARHLKEFLDFASWPDSIEGGNDLNAILHNLKPAIREIS